MRAWLIVICVTTLGVQTLAAQDSVSAQSVRCLEATAAAPACGSDEQHRVWICGDVLLIQLEEPPLVRFGRTKPHAQRRILAVVRFSTGPYFVFPAEEVLRLLVENMRDGGNRCTPVTRVDSQPVPVIARPDANQDRALE